jgi:hypothetical protein
MTAHYLYRHDTLPSLRRQVGDPWLRARRLRKQPAIFPHWQLGEALAQAKPGNGVFQLSMWRSLREALPDLISQHLLARQPDTDISAPLMLQRVRADHPMFLTYQHGDDEHLPGKALLFWDTVPCSDAQDWSADGVHHDDIEVFHPDGYWAPFDQVVTTHDAPPTLAPGWTRLLLEPAYACEPDRVIDARWVDPPRLGRCVFARIPVWSPAIWPADWYTLQLLGQTLLVAFPELILSGQAIVALERTGYIMAYDIAIFRTVAARASWFARVFHGAADQPASATFRDAELLSQEKTSVTSVYAAAGLACASLGTSAFVYGSDAMAILETEAVAELARMESAWQGPPS